MTAAAWAERVTATAFANRVDDLDRSALAVAPAYLDTVDRLDRDLYDAAKTYRDERRTSSIAADPRLTDALRPRAWRTVLRVASMLTAAATLALYFSRADVLPGSTIATAGVLMATTAALLLVTALPLTRRRPPTLASVVFSGLGALAGVAAAIVLARSGLSESGWFWVVAVSAATCVVIAVMQGIIRGTIGSAGRTELDGALEAESTDHAAVLTGLLHERVSVLEETYRSLPAALRSRVEGDLADAGQVLARRRLLSSAAVVSQHTPGMLILDAGARTASVVLGLRDFPSVVPELARGGRG
ncbi:hypothetical protein E6C70_15540 [Glaciibacter flavus]|uniref:Uncharacterized protein n=1 Tax=Orlajensenia flava TaxID=2565934 RepID=A0A4S4FKN1_9MICO|nr:hypothetical protein [Glaciibacter flavus]THG30442.1 hypothetical protein E6C70_15540 [Glaciibacter flavus]